MWPESPLGVKGQALSVWVANYPWERQQQSPLQLSNPPARDIVKLPCRRRHDDFRNRPSRFLSLNEPSGGENELCLA
jgi:hypothetical protein